MTRFFINLPLRVIKSEPGRLDEYIKRGIAPEIGLDALSLDATSEKEHYAIAKRLKDAGLSVGIHLPFFDLQPEVSTDLFGRQR